MLSSFFTRLTNLFNKPSPELPQVATEPKQDESAVLETVDAMREEQAVRSEYLYVCTDHLRDALRIGSNHGYPPSKVKLVSNLVDVAGVKNAKCVMGAGWGAVAARTSGRILRHMEANGWQLVDELGYPANDLYGLR